MGYWTKEGSIAELDFVAQRGTEVLPLEVKSAFNTKAKSLALYQKLFSPPEAVKSSLKRFSTSRQVRSIPLYMLRDWWQVEDVK